MREIKFRAWDKANKRMLHVVEPHDQGKREYYPFEVGIGFSGWSKDDIILMQYTGLKDKNGKEIYEGDICKRNGHLRRIEFYEGGFMCIPFNDKGVDIDFITALHHGWNILNFISDLQVIGNIYENPELLTTTNNRK